MEAESRPHDSKLPYTKLYTGYSKALLDMGGKSAAVFTVLIRYVGKGTRETRGTPYDDFAVCVPVDSIKDELGLTKKQVNAAIAQLTKGGYIALVPGLGGRNGRASVYVVLVDKESGERMDAASALGTTTPVPRGAGHAGGLCESLGTGVGVPEPVEGANAADLGTDAEGARYQWSGAQVPAERYPYRLNNINDKNAVEGAEDTGRGVRFLCSECLNESIETELKGARKPPGSRQTIGYCPRHHANVNAIEKPARSQRGKDAGTEKGGAA